MPGKLFFGNVISVQTSVRESPSSFYEPDTRPTGNIGNLEAVLLGWNVRTEQVTKLIPPHPMLDVQPEQTRVQPSVETGSAQETHLVDASVPRENAYEELDMFG